MLANTSSENPTLAILRFSFEREMDGCKSLYFGNRSKVHQAKGNQAAAQLDAKKADELGKVEAK
jgi:hypothetical protein